jgi:4'-phosphopantetheinyl transferase
MHFRHSDAASHLPKLPSSRTSRVPSGGGRGTVRGGYRQLEGGATNGRSEIRMEGESIVTVAVWPLAVSAARLAALRGVLSADEQARVDRIRLEAAAQEFIVGRGTARELLAAELSCAPGEIAFGTGKHGKPHLVTPSRDLAFNLSHSGGFCALALGRFSRIGVDIEALRPTVGDLAKSVFSSREAARYVIFPAADRMRVFFRAWVAKEAYLKATGAGLAGGLKTLELDLTADHGIRPYSIDADRAAAGAWRLHGFDVADSIFGAVAVETGGREVAIMVRHIDAE